MPHRKYEFLLSEDRFAPQYFYWNPLWRPPDGEEFIVSREQETKFDKEKVTSLGTPSFRAHWKWRGLTPFLLGAVDVPSEGTTGITNRTNSKRKVPKYGVLS